MHSFLFELHNRLSEALLKVTQQLETANIDWRHLAEHGVTMLAVKQLRNQDPKLTLKEAFEKVRAFQNS